VDLLALDRMLGVEVLVQLEPGEPDQAHREREKDESEGEGEHGVQGASEVDGGEVEKEQAEEQEPNVLQSYWHAKHNVLKFEQNFTPGIDWGELRLGL